MKHRGRHRRRRRGRALRATLAGTALALTAAATLISASQATVADAPGALKPVAASGSGSMKTWRWSNAATSRMCFDSSMP